jgi:hypothetical protein
MKLIKGNKENRRNEKLMKIDKDECKNTIKNAENDEVKNKQKRESTLKP